MKSKYKIKIIEKINGKEIILFSMPITKEEINDFIDYDYKARK